MVLRGRAAQPVRPGATIKGVLLGQTPLATGALVTEAAITDLAGAYKELIKRENALRPKEKRLRGMTYKSFLTLFKFAQLLGLVELVREEPMEFPPPKGHLYSVRRHDGVHVVISTRRIFRLTDVGREDERSWTNLCKAWIESWPAPQKVEYAPPYAPPVEEAPPRPPRVPRKPPVFKWVAVPSPRQFRLFLRHLESLEAIGVEDLKVISEMDALSMKVGDWLVEIEDSLAEAVKPEEIARFENWQKVITDVSEALMDRDLSRAIASLRELT